MTTSEIIRLIIVIVLVAIVIARRTRVFEKIREARRRKRLEEEKQQELQEKRERRLLEKQRREAKQSRTAEILRRTHQGAQQRSVKVAGQRIWFFEGGDRDATSVLLLHGFAADKEHWSELAKLLLVDGYHVVAPDLPGFGQNERHPDLSYDVTSQTKRLRAFAHKVKLERYHLVGHSVGATIAAAIAYAAPEDVLSLTLIEPFGLRVPYDSELDEELARDRNPMVIATPEAYDNLLRFTYVDPPEIDEELKTLRARQAAEHRSFYLKMWQEIRRGDRAYLLDLLLPELRRPILAVQGARSRVIHPATAGVIETVVHGARAVVIDDSGHLPMVEKPREVARHLLDFLRATETRASQKEKP